MSTTNTGTTKRTVENAGFISPRVDSVALVTGSSGVCGARLVEMLLERGTKIVVAFDILPPDDILKQRFDAATRKGGGTIIFKCGRDEGDLTSAQAVEAAFTCVQPTHTIQIVYHVAALVGPFYDKHVYWEVNVQGTNRIIEMCRKHGVLKLVYSSSPGTRFTGADINGLTEDDLPIPSTFLAVYAETKAHGEVAVSKANNNNTLLTISVAPHQIYGPHDKLFLQKFLEVSGSGRLRIFGHGGWKISLCYVDNYAHGLMCGADSLYKDSPALAKFYIVTDGPPQNAWALINEAGIAMGFADLNQKFHLPLWLLYLVATVANVAGFCLGKKFKLNYFSLRMMSMHRYFDISNAKRDLLYRPVKVFEKAWPETLTWFRHFWLPGFLEEKYGKKKTL